MYNNAGKWEQAHRVSIECLLVRIDHNLITLIGKLWNKNGFYSNTFLPV